MNSRYMNKVLQIEALKNKPREDEARNILDDVANDVQKIMRRRNWRVKLLSEICPSDPNILGSNVRMGEKVELRLRKVDDDGNFYTEILDTMLHELCHNVHDGHCPAFMKLWNDLRKVQHYNDGFVCQLTFVCPVLMMNNIHQANVSSYVWFPYVIDSTEEDSCPPSSSHPGGIIDLTEGDSCSP
ncbi:hypothetical protein V5N11_034193 [Cardamine amara subsp. amara]|uniref:WLM domain-containing protein n=1 Tax=Cardamine amara subsp. amara TaxID=228776 RepID=A0ABD1BR55_CARAN